MTKRKLVIEVHLASRFMYLHCEREHTRQSGRCNLISLYSTSVLHKRYLFATHKYMSIILVLLYLEDTVPVLLYLEDTVLVLLYLEDTVLVLLYLEDTVPVLLYLEDTVLVLLYLEDTVLVLLYLEDTVLVLLYLETCQ